VQVEESFELEEQSWELEQLRSIEQDEEARADGDTELLQFANENDLMDTTGHQHLSPRQMKKLKMAGGPAATLSGGSLYLTTLSELRRAIRVRAVTGTAWEARYDDNTREKYYYNVDTREFSWERPLVLRTIDARVHAKKEKYTGLTRLPAVALALLRFLTPASDLRHGVALTCRAWNKLAEHPALYLYVKASHSKAPVGKASAATTSNTGSGSNQHGVVFDDVDSAVAAASAGHTIVLGTGSHYVPHPLVIDKQIRLLSQGVLGCLFAGAVTRDDEWILAPNGQWYPSLSHTPPSLVKKMGLSSGFLSDSGFTNLGLPLSAEIAVADSAILRINGPIFWNTGQRSLSNHRGATGTAKGHHGATSMQPAGQKMMQTRDDAILAHVIGYKHGTGHIGIRPPAGSFGHMRGLTVRNVSRKYPHAIVVAGPGPFYVLGQFPPAPQQHVQPPVHVQTVPQQHAQPVQVQAQVQTATAAGQTTLIPTAGVPSATPMQPGMAVPVRPVPVVVQATQVDPGAAVMPHAVTPQLGASTAVVTPPASTIATSAENVSTDAVPADVPMSASTPGATTDPVPVPVPAVQTTQVPMPAVSASNPAVTEAVASATGPVPQHQQAQAVQQPQAVMQPARPQMPTTHTTAASAHVMSRPVQQVSCPAALELFQCDIANKHGSGACVIVTNGGSASISACRIMGAGSGILIESGSSVYATFTSIQECGASGITVNSGALSLVRCKITACNGAGIRCLPFDSFPKLFVKPTLVPNTTDMTGHDDDDGATEEAFSPALEFMDPRTTVRNMLLRSFARAYPGLSADDSTTAMFTLPPTVHASFCELRGNRGGPLDASAELWDRYIFLRGNAVDPYQAVQDRYSGLNQNSPAQGSASAVTSFGFMPRAGHKRNRERLLSKFSVVIDASDGACSDTGEAATAEGLKRHIMRRLCSGGTYLTRTDVRSSGISPTGLLSADKQSRRVTSAAGPDTTALAARQTERTRVYWLKAIDDVVIFVIVPHKFKLPTTTSTSAALVNNARPLTFNVVGGYADEVDTIRAALPYPMPTAALTQAVCSLLMMQHITGTRGPEVHGFISFEVLSSGGMSQIVARRQKDSMVKLHQSVAKVANIYKAATGTGGNTLGGPPGQVRAVVPRPRKPQPSDFYAKPYLHYRSPTGQKPAVPAGQEGASVQTAQQAQTQIQSGASNAGAGPQQAMSQGAAVASAGAQPQTVQMTHAQPHGQYVTVRPAGQADLQHQQPHAGAVLVPNPSVTVAGHVAVAGGSAIARPVMHAVPAGYGQQVQYQQHMQMQQQQQQQAGGASAPASGGVYTHAHTNTVRPGLVPVTLPPRSAMLAQGPGQAPRRIMVPGQVHPGATGAAHAVQYMTHTTASGQQVYVPIGQAGNHAVVRPVQMNAAGVPNGTQVMYAVRPTVIDKTGQTQAHGTPVLMPAQVVRPRHVVAAVGGPPGAPQQVVMQQPGVPYQVVGASVARAAAPAGLVGCSRALQSYCPVSAY
jgi:hypothetical protein